MEDTVNPNDVIYPEILFAEEADKMVVWTRLRKRNNGIYYFWDYKQARLVEPDADRAAEKEKLITQLHFEIYMIQVMGVIDKNARKEDNTPLWERDGSQKSEERRLIEKYQLNNQTN